MEPNGTSIDDKRLSASGTAAPRLLSALRGRLNEEGDPMEEAE
jgi:hypothetical protein